MYNNLTVPAINSDEANKMAILREKVENHIQKNALDIQTAFNSIENDWKNLNDFIVPSDSFEFYIDDERVMAKGFGTGPLRFNGHSIMQMAVKYHIPSAYLKSLHSGNDWQKSLCIEILNKHAKNADREKVLIREVNGITRGVLSDSYKRLSTRIIFLAFLSQVQNHDMVLLSSHNSDTRSYLEAINPNIVSIPTAKNGTVHMVYGVQLRNSEFGHGALELRGYEMQCVCLNGLVTKSEIREVHLGKKLPTNIALSAETYRKDSEAKASLVKDYIKHFFSDDAIELKKLKIQKAASMEIEIDKEIKRLPKIGASDQEAEQVKEIMLRNNPNDGVQGEATLWKFAQAVGAMARNNENPERKRELEEIAGSVLDRTNL